MSDQAAAITLYGLRNCDTCRRAWKWLEERDLDYRFHDLRRDGIEADRVQAWCARLGTDALVNRGGQTWRRLDPADRERGEVGLRQLLVEEPALIKRPVVELPDGDLVVGWNDSVRARISG